MKCFINKLLFISLLVICSSSAFHNAAKDSHFLSAHQPSSSSSLFKTAHMRVEDEQVISSNAIASHLNPRIKRNSGTASQNTAQQAKKITLTSEDKKNRAMKAYKQTNRGKSDAYISAQLDEVKSVLNQIKERTKKQLNINKNTNADVNKNTAKVGVQKSFAEVNKEAGTADYLYQDDILVTPELLQQLKAEVNDAGSRKKRAAPTTSSKWPTAAKGIIYYILDSSLSAYKVSVIKRGLQYWEDNVCINFEPATASATKGLNFSSGSGCYAVLGSYKGFQDVSIGDGCEYFGIVTHEIGHSLGLLHEQSRRDRDKYIQISSQNMESSSLSQYDIMPASLAASPTTPYDYGQHKGPSFYDIRELNNYLGCNAACASSNTQCENGGYPDPKNCTKCKCPLGFGGTLCDTIQPSEGVTCGKVLTATTSAQTLSVTVGTPSRTDTAQACYYHIKSASNTFIEVTVTTVNATCMAGCWFSALEVKIGNPTGNIDGINVKSPFEGTGYRFCCSSDYLNVPFVSTTNLVPVIAYGDDRLQFSIKFRQVNANATTTTRTTTTTTTTATTTSAYGCVDFSTDCADRAYVGQCEDYTPYMLNGCQISCGVCTASEGCIDDDDWCPYWASVGLCKNEQAYMLANCQKSCNVCV